VRRISNPSYFHPGRNVMSPVDDVWYVRFPDGQVVRAQSTEAVRRHLISGRIPRGSLVRRSPEEEWTSLEWVPELSTVFAEEPTGLHGEPMISESQALSMRDRPASAPAAPSRPRRDLPHGDPLQLQTVGARGMVEALLQAVDSTLVRIKVMLACLVGLLSGAVFVLARQFGPSWDWPWSWVPWAAEGLVLLLIGAIGTVLLTQATFVELSQARSARWADAWKGWFQPTVRLVLADLVVLGIPLAFLVLLPFVPRWLASAELGTGAEDIVASIVLVISLVIWWLFGPLVAFALLLGPILIVEECSTAVAMRLWGQFVRQHLGRLFFYEALAVSLAVLVSVPLLFPLGVAPWLLSASSVPLSGTLEEVWEGTFTLLTGLALTPMIAYLVVANVFIYLNLRYQISSGLDRRP
jgi:hypothetical protein